MSDAKRRYACLISVLLTIVMITAILTGCKKTSTDNNTDAVQKTEQTSDSSNLEKGSDPQTEIEYSRQWLSKNAESTKKVYTDEIKERVSQKNFDTAWSEEVRSIVADIKGELDSKGVSSTNAYSLKSYGRIYGTVWNDTGNMAQILSAIDSFIAKNTALNDYMKKNEDYSELINKDIYEGYFYVNQNMSTAYPDTILGGIRKGLNSLFTKGSSWIAYNVETTFGVDYPGDYVYVLHSDDSSRFSTRGSYYVYYADTAKTVTLSDSSGFNTDAPVYDVVNMDEYDEFQNEYTEKSYELYSAFDQLESSVAFSVNYIPGVQDANAAQSQGDSSQSALEESASSDYATQVNNISSEVLCSGTWVSNIGNTKEDGYVNYEFEMDGSFTSYVIDEAFGKRVNNVFDEYSINGNELDVYTKPDYPPTIKYTYIRADQMQSDLRAVLAEVYPNAADDAYIFYNDDCSFLVQM